MDELLREPLQAQPQSCTIRVIVKHIGHYDKKLKRHHILRETMLLQGSLLPSARALQRAAFQKVALNATHLRAQAMDMSSAASPPDGPPGLCCVWNSSGGVQ